MPGLDETRPFVPLRIAVLTLSDAARSRRHVGSAAGRSDSAAGHELAARALLPDDPAQLEAQLRAWIADPAVEVVITTGGTGVTGATTPPR
jgi:molybdenum cofactor biosynthesis protein B